MVARVWFSFSIFTPLSLRRLVQPSDQRRPFINRREIVNDYYLGAAGGGARRVLDNVLMINL